MANQAFATLATTTLVQAVPASASILQIASTTGVTPGVCLYIDRELMRVVRLGTVSGYVTVLRGVEGTHGRMHGSGATVYIGRGDQFYNFDPSGLPVVPVLVNPWINVIDGRVWLAEGDDVGPGNTGASTRYWQLVTNVPGTAALGVTTQTQVPSA